MLFRNIIEGMGSLNLFPPEKEYNKIQFPLILSDEEALKSDWESVGKDLLIAAKVVDTDQK
jgi:hypothetical protein